MYMAPNGGADGCKDLGTAMGWNKVCWVLVCLLAGLFPNKCRDGDLGGLLFFWAAGDVLFLGALGGGFFFFLLTSGILATRHFLSCLSVLFSASVRGKLKLNRASAAVYVWRWGMKKTLV